MSGMINIQLAVYNIDDEWKEFLRLLERSAFRDRWWVDAPYGDIYVEIRHVGADPHDEPFASFSGETVREVLQAALVCLRNYLSPDRENQVAELRQRLRDALRTSREAQAVVHSFVEKLRRLGVDPWATTVEENQCLPE